MSGRYAVASRLNSFRGFCERKGYDLLPDDYRFIDKSLEGIARTAHKAILEHYLEEWAQGMVHAEVGSKAQGEGRRRANQWLLRYKEEFKAKPGDWSKCFD